MDVRERIEALRRLMAASGLNAYYVPSTDPHQSEYVAETWQRRGFLSGFTGSAGTVVVTADRAGLWTDSRYYLQAGQQLEGSGVELFRQGEPGVPEIDAWLPGQLKSGDLVGLDPEVVSLGAWQTLAAAMKPHGIRLVPREEDLVESVWGAQRPPVPANEVQVHAVQYAGMTVEAKIGRVQEALRANRATAIVFSALDEIAWLFNLRGSDVDYNPVFIAFAIVTADKAMLFTDRRRLSPAAARALPANVEVKTYASFMDEVKGLAVPGAVVWTDPATTSYKVADAVHSGGADALQKAGPVAAWKAVKNPAEMGGMVRAHVRDGVAMVKFLHWLSRTAPRGNQTELTVGDKLRELRAESPLFVGMSFATIVGYGPHGAIVHYSASPESNAKVGKGNLLILDSGGQYLDGTTDITRTVSVGEPTQEQKTAYTAVLQGHLALRRCRFLHGANGYQLDILARSRLWAHGLNYGHGTGHGLGAYLCVHEGPFSVSLRKNMTPLEVGHVLSNEPGFYKADGWGVRIENIVTVVESLRNENGVFLGFDDLTLCPYDRSLIDVNLLDATEREQVDAYHRRVYETLAPRLPEKTAKWLKSATRPLPRPKKAKAAQPAS